MRSRRGRATVTGENLSKPLWQMPLARSVGLGRRRGFVSSQKPGDLPLGLDWIRFAERCTGLRTFQPGREGRAFLFPAPDLPPPLPARVNPQGPARQPVHHRSAGRSPGNDRMAFVPAAWTSSPRRRRAQIAAPGQPIRSSLSAATDPGSQRVEQWWHYPPPKSIMERSRSSAEGQDVTPTP